MKVSRERFQNGSLRRVPVRPVLMYGGSGFAITQNRIYQCDKTFSTVEYPTETAVRRALQAF